MASSDEDSVLFTTIRAKFDNNGNLLPNVTLDVSCTICNEKLAIVDPVDDDHHEWVVIPGCGHVFCSNCIENWVEAKRQPGSDDNPVCPMCRSRMKHLLCGCDVELEKYKAGNDFNLVRDVEFTPGAELPDECAYHSGDRPWSSRPSAPPTRTSPPTFGPSRSLSSGSELDDPPRINHSSGPDAQLPLVDFTRELQSLYQIRSEVFDLILALEREGILPRGTEHQWPEIRPRTQRDFDRERAAVIAVRDHYQQMQRDSRQRPTPASDTRPPRDPGSRQRSTSSAPGSDERLEGEARERTNDKWVHLRADVVKLEEDLMNAGMIPRGSKFRWPSPMPETQRDYDREFAATIAERDRLQQLQRDPRQRSAPGPTSAPAPSYGSSSQRPAPGLDERLVGEDYQREKQNWLRLKKQVIDLEIDLRNLGLIGPGSRNPEPERCPETQRDFDRECAATRAERRRLRQLQRDHGQPSDTEPGARAPSDGGSRHRYAPAPDTRYPRDEGSRQRSAPRHDSRHAPRPQYPDDIAPALPYASSAYVPRRDIYDERGYDIHEALYRGPPVEYEIETPRGNRTHRRTHRHRVR